MNRGLLEIIDRVTPDYEPIAFDEAFIDVSGAHRLFGSSVEIAKHLRGLVMSELGLACSVGIGRTKLIAKLASKSAKPHVYLSDKRVPVVVQGWGVHTVEEGDEHDFLFGHSLRALPGIGPKTMARMTSLGISTIADASDVGRHRLSQLLGAHQGGLIADFIQGIDNRRVESQRDARSIGHETTFARDLYDRDELASRVREFATSVASRTRENGLLSKTVTLKIRYRDLTFVTRSTSVNSPFTNASDIASAASVLLGGVEIERGVRLLGIHLSNFVDLELAGGEQLALFGSTEQDGSDATGGRQVELDEATDEIRRRFGQKSLESLAVVGRRSPDDTRQRRT
jgi:DNA polymerase-4